MQLLEKNAWKLFFMGEEEHQELAGIRKKLRYTLDQMAAKTGAANTSQYKNWEYGRSRVPKIALLKARALMTGDPVPDVGPPQGARTESEVPIPYVGRVSASSKMEWIDPLEADLTEFVPVHMASTRGIFCARVQGDSMLPLLQPDDLLVFKSVEYARLGMIVYYAHEENRTVAIKQLKHDGIRPVLRSLNPAYKEVPANGKALGVLIGYIRKQGTMTVTVFNPDGIQPEIFSA